MALIQNRGFKVDIKKILRELSDDTKNKIYLEQYVYYLKEKEKIEDELQVVNNLLENYEKKLKEKK
tara:strand:+ start:468 stop:665 length:198 start_codon:yes stop_codon:yes gene_type:complete